ncbi:MAG: hypothetical protein AB1696_03190 [Planctomycetota bacterium]
MSSGPMHQYQVDLAAELAAPAVGDFIRRNMKYAKVGSGWHDAMTLPDGGADRGRVVAHWINRGVPFAQDLAEWGFADERPFVRRHFICGPDWYLRRMQQAAQEGNEPKAAVIWGIFLHSCEYLTASKCSSMIVHDLPDDLAWAERWLVNGHPFQDEFAYETRPREFDNTRVISMLRDRVCVSPGGMSCCELYAEMLRRRYFEFFPDELQWLIDCEAESVEKIYSRYEDLCYRELAGTLNLALAGLRDVLADRDDDPQDADILFLIREDLWRRCALEGKMQTAGRVIEGLRYISSACKLGLPFALWSGEGAPDLNPYHAVVALCGEPMSDEDDFRRAIRGHDHVLVVNHNLDDEKGFEPFFAGLRRLLDPKRVPEGAHMTRAEIVSAFRRLAELRSPKTNLGASWDLGGRDAGTVMDLSGIHSEDRLSCVMWNGRRHPAPHEFIQIEAEAGRWAIHAPAHGTLHLRKPVALPRAGRILFRLAFHLKERIAVGMRIECLSDGAQIELLRMHVTGKELQRYAFDLTRFAGQTIELHFAWDTGYDFGYEDKDILIVERPEIICLT